MKNFKQFSEELNEAVSTGYKEPVDLGQGGKNLFSVTRVTGAITARENTKV